MIVAEGIESEEHIDTARAMGALLGQGWLYGLPARTPGSRTGSPRVVLPPPRWRPPEGTPFTVVSDVCDVRRSSKHLLFAMSRHLEAEAAKLGRHGVVLGAFQSADRFGSKTASLYEKLADDAAFVAALGAGMTAEPATGVRGAELLSSIRWWTSGASSCSARTSPARSSPSTSATTARTPSAPLRLRADLRARAGHRGANALMARVAPA